MASSIRGQISIDLNYLIDCHVANLCRVMLEMIEPKSGYISYIFYFIKTVDLDDNVSVARI